MLKKLIILVAILSTLILFTISIYKAGFFVTSVTFPILLPLFFGSYYLFKKRENIRFMIVIFFFIYLILNLFSYLCFFLTNDSLSGIFIIGISLPFAIFLTMFCFIDIFFLSKKKRKNIYLKNTYFIVTIITLLLYVVANFLVGFFF